MTSSNNQIYNDIMADGSKERPPMLAPGSYAQWKSQFTRYVDTKPNRELLKKTIYEGPYIMTEITHPETPKDGDRPRVPGYTEKETYANTSPENNKLIDAEVEAVHMILNGIRNDFTILRMLAQIIEKVAFAMKGLNKLKVDNMQVNVKFPQQIQPEWPRFVTIVKQANNLDNVSYHTLFDILKQHQNKVNEISAKRISRNANPLALVAATQNYLDDYYQAPLAPKLYKTHTPSSRQITSTRTLAASRNKGKEIIKPPTPPCESASEENDEEQVQKDKHIQKSLALIAKHFKNIYKPTNNNLENLSNTRNKNVGTSLRTRNDKKTGQFVNQRAGTVAGNMETIGNQVVQQSGIQCFNCKGFGHFPEEKQSEWLQETDEEPDEQELEAHYIQHYEQTESISDTYVAEMVDSNDERVLLTSLIGNLKLNVDKNKIIKKQLKKSNTSLNQENEKYKHDLKYCKIKLERNKTFQTNQKEKEEVELKCKEVLDLLACNTHKNAESLKTEAYRTFLVKEENAKLVNQISMQERQISKIAKEKEELKKDFKEREDKDIDKQIALENQVKILSNIYLKKAQWEKPCLYNVQYDKNDLANMFAPESEETIQLAEKSRSKLGDLVKPYDYTKLNNLYDLFVPQQQKSREQLYFSNEVKKNIFKTPFQKKPTNLNPITHDIKLLVHDLLIPLAHKALKDVRIFENALKEEMLEDLKYVKSVEKEVDDLKMEIDDHKF
ncbi:hypothetical protein Tco_1370635 [Tanacetum coccineum]